MRGKVFLVFAVAVFALHSVPSHGADDGNDNPSDGLQAIPGISPEDMKAIASQLKVLSSSDVFQSVVQDVGSGDQPLDIGFLDKALQAVGGLLSDAGSTYLIPNGANFPREALESLFEQGEESDEETLEAILMYFFSLKKVLNENTYLRSQVTDLIRRNAEKLLANGSLSEVLGSIAKSQVFADLKDEVEEDIESKGLMLANPDVGDEMSR